jgi:multidrug efflux system membrane fusion protein
MSMLRKALGVLVSLIALGAVLVTGVLVSRRIDQRPRTDDAFLQAYIVHMAPDVSGRIIELDVRDNQKVQRGQVLFRIDPDPYKLRVEQARASVRGLEATLAVTTDQVASQTSKADAATSAITAAEARRAYSPSSGAASSPPNRSIRPAPPSAPRKLRWSRRGCRPLRLARESRAPSRSRPSWMVPARLSPWRSAT